MVALALEGALQAVDGVANKQADMAFVTAADAEKAARFASAEAIRWIEWGMRSYGRLRWGSRYCCSRPQSYARRGCRGR